MKRGLFLRWVSAMTLQLLVLMAWGSHDSTQFTENDISLNLKDIYIELSLQKASIKELFEQIEAKTDFRFFYDRDVMLGSESKYSINKTVPLYDLLLEVSKDSHLEFRQVNKNINVRNSTTSEPPKTSKSLAQSIKVIGKVNAEDIPEGIPWVNILVKGTSIGTVTDLEGNYQIEVPSEESILVFSSVGFLPHEVTVGAQKVINVTMNPDIQSLEEVVVTGFGSTQKKESLVSSITTVSPKELKISSSNLTTALAGRIPGVISYQRSGEPGEDNSDFFIRGLGTFGAGKQDPLILIDNIESTSTDLARLQADDIEAFSVLKDATAAAVYGARGANGVILVTTKSGEAGETKFQFRAEEKISTNTRNFQLADNISYMNLENEAVLTRMNPSSPQPLPYAQKKIERTELGDNPLLYPSNDWIDQLVKPYTFNQSYNMSASGGGKRARFYIAGTYNLDNGVLEVDPVNDFNNNIKLANYSVRSNVNIQLTENLEGIVRVYGQFDDYQGPLGGQDRFDPNKSISGGAKIFNMAISSNPVMFPDVYPAHLQPYIDHPLFGGASAGSNSLLNNPYAEMVKGYEVKKASTMQPQLELKQNLDFVTPGLKVGVMGYLRRYSRYTIRRSYDPFYYTARENPISREITLDVLNDGEQGSIGTTGTETLDFDVSDLVSDSRVYAQATTNYYRTFNDKHDVSGMLIFLMQSYEIGDQSAGSDVQASLPKRNMGVSGRFSYGYDDRYLAEFNFGYNGSERFSEKRRFGFFPSFGLAYHISNEAFFMPLRRVFSDLKLRASYGFVGNDAIGDNRDRFFYLSSVNLNDAGRSARFGEFLLLGGPGVSIQRYPNDRITWEKSEQINLGIDMTLFNDLDIVTEIFHQKRTNILQTRSYIGSTMGLTPSAEPKANTGVASSQGIDVSAVYNRYFGSDRWVQIRSNLTYSTSEYLKLDEVTFPEGEQYRSAIGNSVKQTYGFIAERLFVDDEEVANSPRQFGEYRGGDIKYRDVNGDGVITDADRVPIGYPTVPEIIYGFGGSFGFKQFDFGVFFQGAGRTSFFIDPVRISPFVRDSDPNLQIALGRGIPDQGYQTGLLKVIADSHWSETEENRDLYAFWPRLSDHVVENNVKNSTWWMRNGAFLRLKSVEFGYNFTDRVTDRLHLTGLRLYGRGTNLWSWSHFKLWDVEMGGNGLGYPIQAIYSVGALVNF